MSELEHTGDQSPFDCIRRVRPDGSEYWSARDLMPVMGYGAWREFKVPVDRAMKSASNQGVDVEKNFGRSTKVSGQRGPAAEDYELTRFAAYLIAMNGDPNKPEVAAAQAYFAVKTREAEVAQPALDLLDPDTALDKIIELASFAKEERAARLAAEAEKKMLAAAIERDAPLVAKAEAHSGSSSAVHRQEFAREVQAWGVKQNVDIKHADVMRFLGHIGLFIRGERTDTGHATADAQRRGLAFTHKDTAKNGFAYAVGKLTAAGQDYAWKRITKHVADNGTLELPRELRGGDPA